MGLKCHATSRSLICIYVYFCVNIRLMLITFSSVILSYYSCFSFYIVYRQSASLPYSEYGRPGGNTGRALISKAIVRSYTLPRLHGTWVIEVSNLFIPEGY